MSAASRLMTGLGLAVAVAACDDPLGTGREVVLGITKLDVPAEVAPGTAAVITVTVQSGGCRSFKRLEAVRAAGRVTLVAVGNDASAPKVACTADIRYTDHEYRAEPPLTDPFTIVAKEPDGTEMTKVVRIR